MGPGQYLCASNVKIWNPVILVSHWSMEVQGLTTGAKLTVAEPLLTHCYTKCFIPSNKKKTDERSAYAEGLQGEKLVVNKEFLN